MFENVIAVAEHWLEYVAALGPLIIAALVAYIALQQRNINKNRLEHEKFAHELKIKFELFDRRYAQFEALKNYFAVQLRKGRNITEEDRLDFRKETSGSFFLFDGSISQFIKEIDKKARRREHIRKRMALDETADETLIKEDEELSAWFKKQFDNLESRFAPYLRLEEDEEEPE